MKSDMGCIGDAEDGVENAFQRHRGVTDEVDPAPIKIMKSGVTPLYV